MFVIANVTKMNIVFNNLVNTDKVTVEVINLNMIINSVTHVRNTLIQFNSDTLDVIGYYNLRISMVGHKVSNWEMVRNSFRDKINKMNNNKVVKIIIKHDRKAVLIITALVKREDFSFYFFVQCILPFVTNL